MNFYLLIDILIAYILDLLIGDPYWAPHPVFDLRSEYIGFNGGLYE